MQDCSSLVGKKESRYVLLCPALPSLAWELDQGQFSSPRDQLIRVVARDGSAKVRGAWGGSRRSFAAIDQTFVQMKTESHHGTFFLDAIKQGVHTVENEAEFSSRLCVDHDKVRRILTEGCVDERRVKVETRTIL